jgi:UDP-2-acetamido-3-amino-2,3-dideoxy-glucuronate N-acetyltransferase
VGAGAVVTADVPPFALVVGVPARRVGWMCRCGERLHLVEGRGTCAACGTAYAETPAGLRPIDPGDAAV